MEIFQKETHLPIMISEEMFLKDIQRVLVWGTIHISMKKMAMASYKMEFLVPLICLPCERKFTVIIHDVDEFLRRVHKTFNRYRQENNGSYRLAYNNVSYDVDLYEKFKYSEFHKSRSYSWQNEFRISMDFSEGRFSSAMMEDPNGKYHLAISKEAFFSAVL